MSLPANILEIIKKRSPSEKEISELQEYWSQTITSVQDLTKLSVKIIQEQGKTLQQLFTQSSIQLKYKLLSPLIKAEFLESGHPYQFRYKKKFESEEDLINYLTLGEENFKVVPVKNNDSRGLRIGQHIVSSFFGFLAVGFLKITLDVDDGHWPFIIITTFTFLFLEVLLSGSSKNKVKNGVLILTHDFSVLADIQLVSSKSGKNYNVPFMKYFPTNKMIVEPTLTGNSDKITVSIPKDKIKLQMIPSHKNITGKFKTNLATKEETIVYILQSGAKLSK